MKKNEHKTGAALIKPCYGCTHAEYEYPDGWGYSITPILTCGIGLFTAKDKCKRLKPKPTRKLKE